VPNGAGGIVGVHQFAVEEDFEPVIAAQFQDGLLSGVGPEAVAEIGDDVSPADPSGQINQPRLGVHGIEGVEAGAVEEQDGLQRWGLAQGR